MPNITIANLLGISRQAVSRTLSLMDERIGSTLREMACANQIAVEKINPEEGYPYRTIHPFPGCGDYLRVGKTRCAGLV